MLPIKVDSTAPRIARSGCWDDQCERVRLAFAPLERPYTHDVLIGFRPYWGAR